MFSIRQKVFLICLALCYFCQGQDNFTGFWQPQASLNYKVSSDYSLNFSVASRNYWYRGQGLELQLRQIDVAHFSNLKIRDNQSIGLGLQYRFRNPFEPERTNEFRLTQQYNITFRPQVIRIGHRLRSEQRLLPSLTIFRFRYRFALDSPLQGEKLDLGEAYIISSAESLFSASKNRSSILDKRFTVQLGWLLSERVKLQGGLEYRLENFTSKTQHMLFFLTSTVISL